MTNAARLLLISLFSVALAGCFDGDNDDDTADLVVLHAAADAPNVNVRGGGGTLFSDVPFKSGGERGIEEGTYNLSVDARLPGDQTTTVIRPTEVRFRDGIRYYAAAVGTVGAGGPTLLLVKQTDTDASDGNAQVQVAHLASAAPTVDIYVTAPGDDLGSASPIATLTFQDVTDPVEVPAGDYRIRVTPQGSATVVFDSGTVALADDQELFIGAVDNTNFGDSPISLIVEDDGDVSEIVDADATAGVRAVHNSYDAPDVDLYVDTVLAAEDLAFPNAFPGSGNDPDTDYADLPAGTTNIGVTAANDPNVVADADLDLVGGQAYTVLAANAVSSLELLPYEDDNRSIATAAKLRVIHGAAMAPNVDVYAVAQGNACPGNADPLLSDVPYQTSSGYLEVAAADYTVCVTVAGTGTVAIGPVDISLVAGGVYTVVAREVAGDGSSFTLTTLGDF
ncbi:DUF4397 domain-containing protein [Marinobacter bohaiensis]|uniref:DUF4397 domain-containing protein n=1 Tax=Marinobacter bohaiensis TaxID=2201898 RepID=UPI000DAEF0B9|nr:DUF4397 domain-containing protein [Marinobacter bohaiensis]